MHFRDHLNALKAENPKLTQEKLVEIARQSHHESGEYLKSQPVRRLPFPGATKGMNTFDGRSGVKVHHGGQGEVYELSAGTRLADTLPGDRKAEITMDRWLAASMLGDRCKDAAALEYAHDTKSLASGTSGVLVPTDFQGEWIDNLRSFMVLEAAGITTATMTAGTVTSSRVVSDPPVSWRAEGGQLVAGDPTFELRNLVAKSLGVRAQATVELAQDSPDFGNQLLNVMGRALASEIDRVGLVGTGGGQPRGIINTPGISTVPAIGVPTSYSPFVTGMQKLLENNVPLEAADKNAVMSPRTWGSFERLTATDGQPLMRPPALDRMAFRPTNSIPNNLGAGNAGSLAIMGDFRDLILGVRMEASVEVLRLQSYATNLQLEFIGHTRVDFLVRRPASFVVLEGIKAE